MKSRRKLSRWALARKLQDLALRIAAGRPVHLAGKTMRLPDKLCLKEEVEMKGGEIELELEIKWKPDSPGPKRKPARSVQRSRKKKQVIH